MKQHQMSDLSSGHGFLEAPRWHDGRLWLSDFFRKHVIALNADGSYEKIAEARVSYGGRGRLTDVQQPAWGQRIYDAVAPF